MTSTPGDLELLDDLIALAGVRGDDDEQQRWRSLRSTLTSTEYVAGGGDDPAPDGPLAQLRREGWVLREQAIAELPADLRWLFEAGAVSLGALEPLSRTLDVVTLADLLTAVSHQRIRHATALGPDVEAAIAESLPSLRSRVPRIPIGRALQAVAPLLAQLRTMSSVRWAEPAGSLRRGYDQVGDVELVISATDPVAVLNGVATNPSVERCAHRSARRLVISVGHTQVTLRCVPPDEAAATLLCATGSRGHLEQLHRIAAERQLTLTPTGLYTSEGRQRRGDREDALYAALGLPFIPAELREGTDEIERAHAGALPDLVQRDDILGDLHMHTQWSDGRDSVAAMAQAATDLGYRYIAITDHSPSSAAAKNLQTDDIGRQAEDIARVREQFPQLTILHGCEVDILPDGQLDFPDKTLRRFDIVIASLHDRAGKTSQQLLRRYLSAMVHPLVAIIAHPANRLFPRTPGYELDYDRLFEAAVRTRTVLEIDGAPSHIDLDADLARRAAASGVMLAIDGDSHAAGQLERHMQIGLLTARRAGIARQQVLNTRPLPEIRAMFARKRGRFPI